MAVLFVFLDGVGLGPADAAVNPLARARPAFERLTGGQPWVDETRPVRTEGHVFVPLDATLGLPGLPQSGTGQASLFTGVNCAAVAGRHYGPYPHSTSKPILAAHNLFAQLHAASGHPGAPADHLAFANAYPARFFEVMAARSRWTVTTYCCEAAGLPLRRRADLLAGTAVAADLTGAGFPEPGPPLPPHTDYTAGQHLATLAQATTLTLFEYFFTDKAGHSQDAATAHAVLDHLDAFFAGVLATLDPARDLLVVTSDHGNLEDLGTKSHTRYPVPLVAVGAGAHHLGDARSLTDVVPGLRRVVAGR